MIQVTKVTYVAFALHDGKPVHYSMYNRVQVQVHVQ